MLSRNGASIREIATPVCALARNDREFDKFTICVPQNDTERVRVGTITDHVRHDLAVGPADKFQFAAVRKEGGKKAGLRCKKGAIPPSKRGNTPEPSADGSGVVHKPRGDTFNAFHMPYAVRQVPYQGNIQLVLE